MLKPSSQARDRAVLLKSSLRPIPTFRSAINAWKKVQLRRISAHISAWFPVLGRSILITRLGLIWRMVLIRSVRLVIKRECLSWRLAGSLLELADCSFGLVVSGAGEKVISEWKTHGAVSWALGSSLPLKWMHGKVPQLYGQFRQTCTWLAMIPESWDVGDSFPFLNVYREGIESWNFPLRRIFLRFLNPRREANCGNGNLA